jgi:hypothetical protein
MAGMLDNLLAQLQDYAASRPGGMPFDATPADEEDRRKKATPGVPDDWQAGARAVPAEKPQHYEVDYSSGIPVPYQDVKKNAPDLWDDDAKKFHEANPIPPTAMPPMAQGQAIPGLLDNQISAMPAGVGEPPAPVPQPPQAGSPAPQLPPAISVGAAPGTPPAPPVAQSWRCSRRHASASTSASAPDGRSRSRRARHRRLRPRARWRASGRPGRA